MSERVWVVLVNDRHTDIELRAFAQKPAAIQNALDEVMKYVGDGYGVTSYGPDKNGYQTWTLGEEGDYISLQAVAVEAALDATKESAG